MQKWYVKEFSKLTNVTIRTLHHYDQIGLLKPSARYQNGYRIYSESDLVKIQQIIALRFFGFSLSVIKDVMKKDMNVIEQLKAQQEHLQAQIAHLQDASQTLACIIDDIVHNKEQSYSPEVLKHFAQLQENYTHREIVSYKKKWEMLETEILSCLDKKPDSPLGKRLARRWKNLLKEVNGKNAEISAAIFASNDHITSKPEIQKWVEKALYEEEKDY